MNSKCSNQPAHPRRLVWVFAVRRLQVRTQKSFWPNTDRDRLQGYLLIARVYMTYSEIWLFCNVSCIFDFWPVHFTKCFCLDPVWKKYCPTIGISFFFLPLSVGNTDTISRSLHTLKGYCTISSLFPDILLINRLLWEKQIAENPIKKFQSKLLLLTFKVYANLILFPPTFSFLQLYLHN